MPRIACIVEGQGEVQSIPIILRRLASEEGVFPAEAVPHPAPEAVRGAKEWLGRQMRRPYSEIADEAAFADQFDLRLARERAPSFDKLWRDVRDLLT